MFATYCIRPQLIVARMNGRKGRFPLGGIFLCFFRLALPERSQTKKNSAARGKFRLVENSLNVALVTLLHSVLNNLE